MRRGSISVLGVAAIAVAGCGGGDRQDKNEKAGTYNVDVVTASFPAKQHLARKTKMIVEVRNADTRTIPDVAVTVDSFTTRDDRPDLSDPNRPVWIVDDGPVGGVTAYTNTWALGPLKPGRSKRFVWNVTPVRSGAHQVRYRVAAGLNGKAVAKGPVQGTFDVNVATRPSQAYVDPKTGKVVRTDKSTAGGG